MTESRQADAEKIKKDFEEIAVGLEKIFLSDYESCARVITKVRELLINEPHCFERRIEQHQSFADLNKKTWKMMIERLPEEQRLAFECALEEDLRELFYIHYIAVYLETDEGKKPLETDSAIGKEELNGKIQ
ncbi:MAG: hypothetical protein KAR00_00655 [Candidatus Pacebacteria bacterium]|nr:hypothetical protein [Candidatus Paceibacterota bacterium]